MKVEKKVIGNLEKCYAVAVLNYKGEDHFLVAAEKHNQCRLYSTDGELEDVLWEEPGGVMTMVQVPGSDGQFLATHKFYSPNDSKEAKLVIVTPKADAKAGAQAAQNWTVQTLCDLPFVHRFDIFKKPWGMYLLACTLKSGQEYKNDWRFPGKVFAAVLPEDLSTFDNENQLQLSVLKEGMTKNHGYFRCTKAGADGAVVSCEEGVYWFAPPAEKDGEWVIEELIHEPASDGLLLDMDGDGIEELITIAPFHGDTINIYKPVGGVYEKIYEYPEKLNFLHAIFGGTVCRRPMVIIGNREDGRKLLAFSYENGEYTAALLDEGFGAANVFHYVKDEKDLILAANRESDEIAIYTLS